MKRRKSLLFLLFSCSLAILLPILLPLLSPGTPHEFDMFFHLERISEFYRQLREGQVLPGWSTRFAYGFGSPVLIFNYSFPYYLASLALSFGATLLDSFKFVTAFTYIGMFISMYAFLASLVNPISALIGAAAYTWAPYHFDINQHRGAIGEMTAMIFWPAIFWATREIFKKYYAKGFFTSIILWALLLYSHPDFFIMIFPLWSLVLCIEFMLTKNTHAFWTSIRAFGMSLGFMSFYIIPSYFEHTYLGYQSHQGIYTQNFVSWEQLLSQPKIMEFGLPWGALYKSIGWPFIAIAIITGFILITHIQAIRTQRIRAYQTALLIMTGFGIYLLRPASTYVWDHINVLTFITYPQRFLGLVMFCLSVCAGLLSAPLVKRIPWIAIIMIAAFILFAYPFVNLNYVRDSEASLSVRTLDTTDVWGEFMPKDMPKDFIQNGLLNSKQPIITGATGECIQTSVSVSCIVDTKSVATIRFRQFYFPGWTAYADSTPIPIEKNADGTILLQLTKPAHSVRIVFTQTPLRKFSLFLSFIFSSLYLFLLGKIIYTYFRKKKN